MAGKIRLDQLLVQRGLAESRARAQALVMAGLVYCGEAKLAKPGQQLAADALLEVRGRDHPWVSRGGIKLAHAIEHFGLDLEGADAEEAVQACLDMDANWDSLGIIDFADMLYLPVVRRVAFLKPDLGIVDEAQDLSPAARELLAPACIRMVAVGDDRQSIYGFAGADPQSFEQVGRRMGQHVELPLTECFRCGEGIIAEAQTLVPDIRWNGRTEGTVIRRETTTIKRLGRGDMVLCRTNQPLVSVGVQLASEGMPFRWLAEDLGPLLLWRMQQHDSTSPRGALKGVEEEIESVTERAELEEIGMSRASRILDELEACRIILMQCATFADVRRLLREVFRDSKNPLHPIVTTIHRSKGLEAERVFFVKHLNCPMPFVKHDSWDYQQELNLRYVGITRGIREVHLCSRLLISG